MLKRELLSLPHHRSWALTHLKDAGVPFQWHYHPEYEITLTLGAEGMRYIGEDVAPFGHCDLALVGPDVPHTWDAKASDGAPEVYVVFLPRHWLQAQVAAGLLELSPLLDWLAGLGGCSSAWRNRARCRPWPPCWSCCNCCARTNMAAPWAGGYSNRRTGAWIGCSAICSAITKSPCAWSRWPATAA